MSFGNFRKAPTGPVLSREEGLRQGSAVRAAQAALGDIAAVRVFLNSHHDALSGRPIDLAVASDTGLAAVEAVLARQGRSAEAGGAG